MLTLLLSMADEADRGFVERLYDTYATRMYALAYDILKNKEDAEDCVHDTVLTVIEHIERFRDLEEDHLKRLLAVCCRNAAKNRYRQNRRRATLSLTEEESREEIDLVDESADVARLVVDEERATVLHGLVEGLEDIYRDAVALYYFYGMSHREIAAVTHVSEALVRVRLSRARRLLLQRGGDRLC